MAARWTGFPAMAREKGVPTDALRATLVKMVEKNVRLEDIPAILDKKADQLITLSKTIDTNKSMYPDLASSIDQIQTSVDDGDLGGGLRSVFALSIEEPMQSDNQKQQVERWKILKDTQDQKFSIQQDVTISKAQNQYEAYKKWDKYIRQYLLKCFAQFRNKFAKLYCAERAKKFLPYSASLPKKQYVRRASK
jgi:hypothetical protein